MKNFFKERNMLLKQRIVPDTVYGHIPYSGLEEKFLQSKIVIFAADARDYAIMRLKCTSVMHVKSLTEIH